MRTCFHSLTEGAPELPRPVLSCLAPPRPALPCPAEPDIASSPARTALLIFFSRSHLVGDRAVAALAALAAAATTSVIASPRLAALSVNQAAFSAHCVAQPPSPASFRAAPAVSSPNFSALPFPSLPLPSLSFPVPAPPFISLGLGAFLAAPPGTALPCPALPCDP